MFVKNVLFSLNITAPVTKDYCDQLGMTNVNIASNDTSMTWLMQLRYCTIMNVYFINEKLSLLQIFLLLSLTSALEMITE